MAITPNDKWNASIAGAAVMLGMIVAHMAFDATEGQTDWTRVIAKAATAAAVAALFFLAVSWMRRKSPPS